jgi:hypothetical protein
MEIRVFINHRDERIFKDCTVNLSKKMTDHFNDGKILHNPLESATDISRLVSNILPDWFDDAASN